MELNGVANIKMIVKEGEDSGMIHPQTAADIYKQLDLLERYMLAYRDAISPVGYAPAWHDITANPSLFASGSDRVEEFKKQWKLK